MATPQRNSPIRFMSDMTPEIRSVIANLNKVTGDNCYRLIKSTKEIVVLDDPMSTDEKPTEDLAKMQPITQAFLRSIGMMKNEGKTEDKSTGKLAFTNESPMMGYTNFFITLKMRWDDSYNTEEAPNRFGRHGKMLHKAMLLSIRNYFVEFIKTPKEDREENTLLKTSCTNVARFLCNLYLYDGRDSFVSMEMLIQFMNLFLMAACPSAKTVTNLETIRVEDEQCLEIVSRMINNSIHKLVGEARFTGPIAEKYYSLIKNGSVNTDIQTYIKFICLEAFEKWEKLRLTSP